MAIDYGQHTLRLNSQYDTRLRRAMDRFKEAVDTLDGKVTVIQASASLAIDAETININGVTSEDLADPTQSGQLFIRTTNYVDSAGTHTVNFSGWSYASTLTINGASTSTAGDMLVLVSGKYSGSWAWYILQNDGWSEIV